MLPENTIFFAVSLNLLGHVLYIKSILGGHAKPNLVSWFVWMLAPFIGVLFQLKAGAGLSVLPVFMAGFGPLIIIITALLKKNAIWKITNFDIICGALSTCALAIFAITHNLEVSILFAILSDGLAYIPTYRKAWSFPNTESVHAYSWAILANVVGLLIIKDWSFTIYSFGIYLIVMNIIMLIILYRQKIFRMK